MANLIASSQSHGHRMRWSGTHPFPMLRIAVVMVLAAALAACGWQLRGAGGATLDGRAVYVSDQAGSADLRVETWRGVESAGGRVVESAGEADLVLVLHGEGDSRQVMSVGPDGEVREYELLYHVEYSVRRPDGEQLLDRQSLRASRAYSYDAADPEAGRTLERELLLELRASAVRLMMFRLQVID